MTHTSCRVLAMPAIVATAALTATGPAGAGAGPLVRSSGPRCNLQPAADHDTGTAVLLADCLPVEW